jgi:ferric-dicitrate binding protein FerR (iron transport regulator)
MAIRIFFLLVFSANFFSVQAAQTVFKRGEVSQSSDRLHYKTGKDGWLILELKTGTRLKLTPLSSLVIESEEPGNQKVRLELGGVFTKVKKTDGVAKRFSLHTKAAVMGVRGTSFFTAYGKNADEWMCVEEGVVDVEDGKHPQAQPVTAGQGVLVDSKSGVTPPKAYEWTKQLNWTMDSASGDVESKIDLDGAYSNLRRLIYE